MVGNTQGTIKFMDFNEVHFKSISNKELAGHRVTSIDVSRDKKHLVAGYDNGSLMLWDLVKSSLLKTAMNIHRAAIITVKFIKGESTRTISSDTKGEVYVTEFADHVFGMSASQSQVCKGHCVFALNPLFPTLPPDPKKEGIFKYSPVAMGDMGGVQVAAMEPSVKVVWEYRYPAQKTDRVLPYVDWGRGALPGNEANDNSVLAIAWGRVVQLIEVRDILQGDKGFVLNGYYVCDEPIDGVWWLAEGVLTVLTRKKELRLIYSYSFAPGEFSQIPVIRSASHPEELEDPYQIGEDVHSSTIRVEHGLAGECEAGERTSYHQTVIVRGPDEKSPTAGKQVLCLCKSCMLSGKLYTWAEYLEEQKQSGKWLNALRVGLKLFSGEIRGFAELMEDKAVKVYFLRAPLKSLLREYLLQSVPKSHKDSALASIAIEFCVGIGAIDYLFADMLKIFADNQQESTYVEALESFILSGKFVSMEVPMDLIKTIVDYYTTKKKVDFLEKLLLNFNLVGTNTDIGYLSKLCITSKLFLLLIYVKTLPNREAYIDPLIEMYTELRIRESRPREGGMDKLFEYGKEVEAGHKYMGYTMLMYVDMCFKRKKFPKRWKEDDRMISDKVWPGVVSSILGWLFAEQGRFCPIRDLMQVDLVCVFDVLRQLFENADLRDMLAGLGGMSTGAIGGHVDILRRVEKIVNDMEPPSLRANGPVQNAFCKFVVQAAARPKIEVPSEMCVAAATRMSRCSQEYDGTPIDRIECEQLLVAMMKNCKLSGKQLEDMINVISNSSYIEVLIYLRELNGDFIKCFETYLDLHDSKARLRIFDWLESVHEKLPEESKEYNKLRDIIYDKLETLVSLLSVLSS